MLALAPEVETGAGAGPSTVEAHRVGVPLRPLNVPQLRLDLFDLVRSVDHPATNLGLNRALGDLDPVRSANCVGLADPWHANDGRRHVDFKRGAHHVSIMPEFTAKVKELKFIVKENYSLTD